MHGEKPCEYPGCAATTSRELFMCSVHWRAVPPDLQRKVYRTWRNRRAALRNPTTYEEAKRAHEEAKREALLAIT